MVQNETSGKTVVYVCWNDKAHVGGTIEWRSLPQKQDTVMCPECGEIVKITQKLS
jgi:hypothetical protein